MFNFNMTSNPYSYLILFILKTLLVVWYFIVRHGSHWGGSPQNGLRDEWTCGMTLVSAYVLHCLSAAWLQLQIMGRSLR